MGFTEQDKKLQTAIRDALYERLTINANKDIGAAYLQAEPEDRLNPSVVLTKEDIRLKTGREKVRTVVLNKYAKALQSPFLTVERVGEEALKVSVVPMRRRENDFKSLDDLQTKNADDLSENPDLGEPML